MEQTTRSDVAYVQSDIDPFVSTVDGSIVSGRRSLREHNLRNNVVNAADFTEHWKKAAEKRDAFYQGRDKAVQKERIEALKYAYDKHSRR